MILNTYLGPRYDVPGRKFIGYWGSLNSYPYDRGPPNMPMPQDYVDESWDVAERALVVQRLEAGTVFESWRGFSYCRFECGKRALGTQCFTADGSWVWPEGFAHYVEKHGVRPPQEFVDYLINLPAELVTMLENRLPRLEAVEDAWPLSRQNGSDCPKKGKTCVFTDKGDGEITCQRGNCTSNRCDWALREMYEEYDQVRILHRKELAPFIKIPWNY